jgi:hypothetical protein
MKIVLTLLEDKMNTKITLWSYGRKEEAEKYNFIQKTLIGLLANHNTTPFHKNEDWTNVHGYQDEKDNTRRH